MLRGKFVPLSAYVRKEERCRTTRVPRVSTQLCGSPAELPSLISFPRPEVPVSHLLFPPQTLSWWFAYFPGKIRAFRGEPNTRLLPDQPSDLPVHRRPAHPALQCGPQDSLQDWVKLRLSRVLHPTPVRIIPTEC